jgi:hypothetical protein
MAELGIILLIKGIPEVINNAMQEAFSDEPRGPNEFPLVFHSLLGVCWGGVSDVGVVGCWFLGDSIC